MLIVSQMLVLCSFSLWSHYLWNMKPAITYSSPRNCNVEVKCKQNKKPYDMWYPVIVVVLRKQSSTSSNAFFAVMEPLSCILLITLLIQSHGRRCFQISNLLKITLNIENSSLYQYKLHKVKWPCRLILLMYSINNSCFPLKVPLTYIFLSMGKM